MPTYSFWVILSIWSIVVGMLTWIIIDIKRYPWKYGAKEK